jgi:hypothetical protein
MRAGREKTRKNDAETFHILIDDSLSDNVLQMFQRVYDRLR